MHVLSQDLVSPAMKHRKHFNSFATPFLVPLAQVPAAATAMPGGTKGSLQPGLSMRQY